MISMLISIEIMLNAVNINFIAINRYLHPQALEGHFFTLWEAQMQRYHQLMMPCATLDHH